MNGGRAPSSGSGKEFEHDDPMELRGVMFSADEETSRSMTRCIVEEYALLGFSRPQVERIFRSPFYAGTWALTRRHGEAFIHGVLDEVFGEGGASDA